MAQTTDAMSMKDCSIETSPDNSTWTDISGFANLVEPDGGERENEESFTFDGDTPIITIGKRGGFEIKVKIVYTEGATDPVEVVRAAYEGASDFYVRWSPKGGNSGDFMYTSSKGYIISPTYPGGEAESAAAMAIEFVLKCATITKTAVTP